MKGRNGPRQPGGGRRTPGPRHAASEGQRQGARQTTRQATRQGASPGSAQGGPRAGTGWGTGRNNGGKGKGGKVAGGKSGDGKNYGKSHGGQDDRKRAAGDFPHQTGPHETGRSAAGRKPSAAVRRPPRSERGERAPDETRARREQAGQLSISAPSSAPSSAQRDAGVQTVTVTADETGMRIDRFLEARFPELSFSHIQRVIRKGELRVNGKRVDSKDRLEEGQSVRVPPLRLDAPRPRSALSEADEKTRHFLQDITLFEDADVMVLNKPAGLAVQGGSGTARHVDGMLEVLRNARGERPRLVHRLDKETAGCLLVAKTRFAASALAKSFRSRSARKIYWALVAGVPKPKQGRISTFLAKEEREDDSFMRVAAHGDEGASHAVTYYAVVETSGPRLSWVSLKPVTGRTHQLRAHMAHIGHAIVGDPKYFNKENWELPGGLQNRLHLLARRIRIPHPRGGMIDVTAPLPPHMQQSWNLLGLDAARFDPIEHAPEE